MATSVIWDLKSLVKLKLISHDLPTVKLSFFIEKVCDKQSKQWDN